MLGNQADGKDAGKRQRVEFGNGLAHIKPHGRNGCQANGYSLHANTTVGPQAREALEKLCKYVCRPAIAASRLEQVIPRLVVTSHPARARQTVCIPPGSGRT